MEEKERVTENLDENGKHSLFSRIKSNIAQRKAKKLEQIQKEQLSEAENVTVKEKIAEANKEVTMSTSKKKKIRNIIFFIFNLLLVAGILLWNVLTSDDFSPLKYFDLDLWFLVVALLFLALLLFFEILSVHRMIYRKTLRSRWFLSYKSLAVLRYYDAITPLSAGGQAFMVTYLTSRDVPASTSLSIPIAKLVFQHIAWLIITFVCLVISVAKDMSTLVSAASIIGFVLAFLLVAFIIFISLSKKAGEKLVSGALKLLVKMHIIKDFDKYYKKTMSFVSDYQNIMKEYSRAKLDVLYQIILHGLRFICLFSIPFFIYCAFKGYEPSKYGEFFVYTALIDLASSFIPLPGGTGMNEITFTFLFKKYLGGATFWALLFWRFCSYYFYLLQGIGLLSYDTIYGNRKYRWIKKRLELQDESLIFRKKQIENFRQERDKRRQKQKKESVTM